MSENWGLTKPHLPVRIMNANFSSNSVVQSNRPPKSYQLATYHHREHPIQLSVRSPTAELIALPLFALLLTLLFQSSRSLCWMIYHRLYRRHQARRLILQRQQIATLERIFSNSVSYKERS